MFKNQILKLSLITIILLGGCMDKDVNNKKSLFGYKSDEYEKIIEKSNIKINDAKKILCTFVKDKKCQGYYLYFIYKNSYVFKDTGFGKSLSGISVRGLNGIYIDIDTGKIFEVIDDSRGEFIFLEKDNYLYLECLPNETEFIAP